MHRFCLASLLLVIASSAYAHFVFIVPMTNDPSKATVVFSDDLEPDENVGIEKLSTLKLYSRDSAGKDVSVESKPGKHELQVTVPGQGSRILFGTLSYGVMQRGEAKPYLLTYYPKAMVGAMASDRTIVGSKSLPVEIVPIVTGAEVRFQFLAGGQPVSDAEVTVIKSDVNKSKVKTDKHGKTEAFPAKGRYGVWAKDAVATPGEFDGKKYDEIRRYATLVVEFTK